MRTMTGLGRFTAFLYLAASSYIRSENGVKCIPVYYHHLPHTSTKYPTVQSYVAMGNSSSARYKDTDIPPKFSVRVLPDDSDMVHTSRDSAHAASIPGHRRSRSAHATVRRSNVDDISPPPPYSRTPPRLDTQLLTPSHSSTNLNLRHLHQPSVQRSFSSQPSSPSRSMLYFLEPSVSV